MLVGIVGGSISLFILFYFRPLLLIAATGASLYWLSMAFALGSLRTCQARAVGRTTISFTSTSAGRSIANTIARAIALGEIPILS